MQGTPAPWQGNLDTVRGVPSTILVVCPTVRGRRAALNVPDEWHDVPRFVRTSAIDGPDTGRGQSALVRLLDTADADASVERVLFAPSDVIEDPPRRVSLGDRLDMFDRVLHARPVPSTNLVFGQTLIDLARFVDARYRALDGEGSADSLRVVWMSALLEREYLRAYAYDVVCEYTNEVVLIGVDERNGATEGDIAVAYRALGSRLPAA